MGNSCRASFRLLLLGLVVALLGTACRAEVELNSAAAAASGLDAYGQPKSIEEQLAEYNARNGGAAGESAEPGESGESAEPVFDAAQIEPNSGAAWDDYLLAVYRAVDDPVRSPAQFETVANGWCLGMVTDEQLALLLPEDPELADAFDEMTDDDCSLRQDTIVMTGDPVDVSSWDDMIAVRYQRAVWWNSRDDFGRRAETMCNNLESRGSLSLDGELSGSIFIELSGILEHGDCDLLNLDFSNGVETVTGVPDLPEVAVPDGGLVVFSSTRDGDNELYTMKPTGELVAQLTNNDVDDAVDYGVGANVSTIGRVVFDRDVPGGGKGLFMIGIDGTGEQQLTPEVRGRYWNPVWSASGGQVAVSSPSLEGDDAAPIVIVGLDGSEVEIAAADGFDSYLVQSDGAGAWTADNRLLYSKSDGNSPELWIMNGDGSGDQRFYATQTSSSFAISPDGRDVLFNASTAGYSAPDQHLYILGLNEAMGQPREIPTAVGKIRHPLFSPDGKWVSYMFGQGFDVNEYYVHSLNDPEQRILLSSPELTDVAQFGRAVWAPDSSGVLIYWWAEDERIGQDEPRISFIGLDGTITHLDQRGQLIAWLAG